MSILAGGILGAGIGFFAASSTVSELVKGMGAMGANMSGGYYFLAIGVGFVLGAVLGGIIGLIVERVSAKREKEANEF